MPREPTLRAYKETLLLACFRTFRADENGASAVDWVTLLVALVTLAVLMSHSYAAPDPVLCYWRPSSDLALATGDCEAAISAIAHAIPY